MPRYTEPEPEQALLLYHLKLILTPQPAPRYQRWPFFFFFFSPTQNVVETLGMPLLKLKDFPGPNALNCEGWAKANTRHLTILTVAEKSMRGERW